MNEYVWLSRIQAASELTVLTSTDIVEHRPDDAISALKDLKAGHSVVEANCPKKVWAEPCLDERPRVTSIPPVFNANGYWIVSDVVQFVIRQFDLGGGSFYPVEVFEEDRHTPIGHGWFCWIIGNTKDSFSKADSLNLQPFGPPNIESDWAAMPFKPQDFEVAVSPVASSGPDVWFEKRLFKSIFFSAKAGDALVEAGLREALILSKARVV